MLHILVILLTKPKFQLSSLLLQICIGNYIIDHSPVTGSSVFSIEYCDPSLVKSTFASEMHCNRNIQWKCSKVQVAQNVYHWLQQHKSTLLESSHLWHCWMYLPHVPLAGLYLTISNKGPLSNSMGTLGRVVRQFTVDSINCANSSLLLTLSVSHSPTLCQTTTPPLRTPTPRSVLWMEKRLGWTVRLSHTGHKFIPHTVWQSDCRVDESLCLKAEGVLLCDVIWHKQCVCSLDVSFPC